MANSKNIWAGVGGLRALASQPLTNPTPTSSLQCLKNFFDCNLKTTHFNEGEWVLPGLSDLRIPPLPMVAELEQTPGFITCGLLLLPCWLSELVVCVLLTCVSQVWEGTQKRLLRVAEMAPQIERTLNCWVWCRGLASVVECVQAVF